jgi:hypothetical protein
MVLLVKWLVIPGIIVTVFCGLVYGVVQQNYRLSANDPQIQIAERYAGVLSSREGRGRFLSHEEVDISRDLSPFVILFNVDGEVVESTAILGGEVPRPPRGVFDYAKRYGENRFTWQPRKDVRIAAVVARSSHGYVLAGRSLREVESRIKTLTLTVFTCWFLLILFLYAVFLGFRWRTKRILYHPMK